MKSSETLLYWHNYELRVKTQDDDRMYLQVDALSRVGFNFANLRAVFASEILKHEEAMHEGTKIDIVE